MAERSTNDNAASISASTSAMPTILPENERIRELTARNASLERELDDLTATLAQAWDQLVPFLQAEPDRVINLRGGTVTTTMDVHPFLIAIMAALDVPMAAAYLRPRPDAAAEWTSEPDDALALNTVQTALDAIQSDDTNITLHDVASWSGLPGTWLFTPLLVNGDVVGAIGVGVVDWTREFTALDALMLRRMTERAAGQIVAARLADSQAREARLLQELQIAGLIQRSIQPNVVPTLPASQVAADWQPATAVGGDAWGWVEQPGGRLACFMVDVAGKGLPAALAAISLHTALRVVLRLDLTPALALEKVNSLFYEAYTQAGILATASVIALDLETGALTAANAGHTPLLVLQSGQWVRYPAHTPPLGVLDEIAPEQNTIVLQAGDGVILFSDGLSEIGQDDEHLWGIEGIIGAVSLSDESGSDDEPLTARRWADRILAGAQKARNGAAPHDDLTLLCIRYTPPATLPA